VAIVAVNVMNSGLKLSEQRTCGQAPWSRLNVIVFAVGGKCLEEEIGLVVLKTQRKKAADSSGFEDDFSKGRADEKRRGNRCDA
jgi:hypothetical protein